MNHGPDLDYRVPAYYRRSNLCDSAVIMGTPHTINICKNCGESIIQWNNTGAWEHLNSATMDQTQSRAYVSGAKSKSESATICVAPRLAVEKASIQGKTDSNHRTATPKS